MKRAADDGASALATSAKKFRRGVQTPFKKVHDKKLKGHLKTQETIYQEAALRAARSEVLLPSEAGFLEADDPMERTFKFAQKDIVKHLDLTSAKKAFDLDLAFGPYVMDYTRSGRHLVFGGRKGQIAMMDWTTKRLNTEIQVKETIRDIKFLHNETMFAVAQKKYVYIYDNNGIEVHCLRDHQEPNKLDFLPYHFLLVSIGKSGYLKYQDTSTGKMVAEHRTKLGDCNCMRQNPYNAIMLLGHSNGTVTMWSPNLSVPIVKMFCHKGPVRSLAVDPQGRYMVSAGMDGQMKVWDVRTYKELHSYYTYSPANCLDISQRGLLGVGFGPHVQIWKDAFGSKQPSPYMTHMFAGEQVTDFHFVPYDDVAGVGHTKGVSSLVIPGSGEPNFDTFEANPFQTTKQRREVEVHQLLDKIQPDMITLDPTFVGRIDTAAKAVLEAEKKAEEEARNANRRKKKEKHKARGKSGPDTREKRKQLIHEKEKREKMRNMQSNGSAGDHGEPKVEPSALDRFMNKRK